MTVASSLSISTLFVGGTEPPRRTRGPARGASRSGKAQRPRPRATPRAENPEPLRAARKAHGTGGSPLSHYVALRRSRQESYSFGCRLSLGVAGAEHLLQGGDALEGFL